MIYCFSLFFLCVFGILILFAIGRFSVLPLICIIANSQIVNIFSLPVVCFVGIKRLFTVSGYVSQHSAVPAFWSSIVFIPFVCTPILVRPTLSRFCFIRSPIFILTDPFYIRY